MKNNRSTLEFNYEKNYPEKLQQINNKNSNSQNNQSNDDFYMPSKNYEIFQTKTQTERNFTYDKKKSSLNQSINKLMMSLNINPQTENFGSYFRKKDLSGYLSPLKNNENFIKKIFNNSPEYKIQKRIDPMKDNEYSPNPTYHNYIKDRLNEYQDANIKGAKLRETAKTKK